MSSAEFVRRYENDELAESLSYAEWIGEYRLLARLNEKATAYRGISFVLRQYRPSQKLKLPTYPHHKHVGSEDVVVASPTPNPEEVLEEVTMLVSLL